MGKARVSGSQHTMFVPPCGKSFDSNIESRLYYCPVERTIRDSEYLGVYKNKSVQAIGRISKVVACTINLANGEVSDANSGLTGEEGQRILDATDKARSNGWDLRENHKFFLCDTLKETDFLKTSPGGLINRRYFNFEEILGPEPQIPNSVAELAALLRQHTWA